MLDLLISGPEIADDEAAEYTLLRFVSLRVSLLASHE
jgi:hypothetical protein